ncbi:MAG: hypothetical protein CUN54_10580, partial [Phototrophicales bacterium]
MTMRTHRLAFSVATFFILVVSQAWAAKKPLDHDSYDRWNRLSQPTISNDGQWVLYTVSPAKGTPIVRAVKIATGAQYELKDSRNARFT